MDTLYQFRVSTFASSRRVLQCICKPYASCHATAPVFSTIQTIIIIRFLDTMLQLIVTLLLFICCVMNKCSLGSPWSCCFAPSNVAGMVGHSGALEVADTRPPHQHASVGTAANQVGCGAVTQPQGPGLVECVLTYSQSQSAWRVGRSGFPPRHRSTLTRERTLVCLRNSVEQSARPGVSAVADPLEVFPPARPFIGFRFVVFFKFAFSYGGGGGGGRNRGRRGGGAEILN